MATIKRLYRDIANLGDFNDDTRIMEPSMTDPSQDETIDALVARMLRGELMNSAPVSYDFEEGTKNAPGDVFDSVPVQHRKGFDIADVAPILDAAKAAAPVPAATVAPEPPKAPDTTLSDAKPITTT